MNIKIHSNGEANISLLELSSFFRRHGFVLRYTAGGVHAFPEAQPAAPRKVIPFPAKMAGEEPELAG